MNKSKRLTSTAFAICGFIILSVINSSCISDTRYAPSYTNEGFASIKIGMTEKQVLDILGDPLYRWKPYDFNWLPPEKRHFVGLGYSESPSSTHYYLRQINLDSGIVAEKIEYFYLD